MEINDLLAIDGILPNLKVSSKKQLLQKMSQHLGNLYGLSKKETFAILLEREKLGSTGVGNGVAIPHGKFNEMSRLSGCFAKLEQPVDFDSLDENPVDLVFVLLAPIKSGAEHLKALKLISRLMKDPKFCNQLRKADGADSLYNLLTKQNSIKAA